MRLWRILCGSVRIVKSLAPGPAPPSSTAYPERSYSAIAATLFRNTVRDASSHANASDAPSASASCKSRDATPRRRCAFFTSTLEMKSEPPTRSPPPPPPPTPRLVGFFLRQHVTHPTTSPRHSPPPSLLPRVAGGEGRGRGAHARWALGPSIGVGLYELRQALGAGLVARGASDVEHVTARRFVLWRVLLPRKPKSSQDVAGSRAERPRAHSPNASCARARATARRDRADLRRRARGRRHVLL